MMRVLYDKTDYNTVSTPWFEETLNSGVKMRVKLSQRSKHRLRIVEVEPEEAEA